ncbi:MAG TPA: hypothetical protein VNN72_07775 [Polyangiaceae bacterium]|nr:hypothetical protein [Polyangiaceae bacterium]
MAINARWHDAHRMPRGAALSQRIAWHVAHAKACGCREMPVSIRAALASGVKAGSVGKPRARAKQPKSPKISKKRTAT